jgi:hypothetical protein
MMFDLNMDYLAGKVVTDARYDGENIYLNLANEGGCITLIPYGDCCANCYILNVDGSEALFGATIEAVQDLECFLTPEEEENLSDYTCIDAWGHRILTNKGICTIEMRVSHNGYYGGSLTVSQGSEVSSAKLLTDF